MDKKIYSGIFKGHEHKQKEESGKGLQDPLLPSGFEGQTNWLRKTF